MQRLELLRQARKAAILCHRAYETDFDHEVLGYTHRRPMIEHNETQCHMVTSPQSSAIIFPGTKWNEWTDIKMDLKASGEALDYVWPEICDVLSMSTYRDKPLDIYGHSLGGKYAADAARRINRINSVHTFGSFKPYSGAEFDTYPHHDRHYSWVNCADIAPRYPLLRRLRAKHVGQLMYMTRGNELLEDVSGWRFWGESAFSPVLRVKDHSIINYINRIERIYIKEREAA